MEIFLKMIIKIKNNRPYPKIKIYKKLMEILTMFNYPTP